MLKNSIDIMLQQKEVDLIDNNIDLKIRELHAIELEKEKDDEARAAQRVMAIQSAHAEAIVEAEPHFEIPSAESMRQRTIETIKENAAVAVKKEATEILKMALRSIELAISNECFSCELGGPGRPELGQIVLRQSYGAYHEIARKFVLKRLREKGYEVEVFDEVYLKISW